MLAIHMYDYENYQFNYNVEFPNCLCDPPKQNTNAGKCCYSSFLTLPSIPKGKLFQLGSLVLYNWQLGWTSPISLCFISGYFHPFPSRSWVEKWIESKAEYPSVLPVRVFSQVQLYCSVILHDTIYQWTNTCCTAVKLTLLVQFPHHLTLTELYQGATFI